MDDQRVANLEEMDEQQAHRFLTELYSIAQAYQGSCEDKEHPDAPEGETARPPGPRTQAPRARLRPRARGERRSHPREDRVALDAGGVERRGRRVDHHRA
jgi:hypothetical protein